MVIIIIHDCDRHHNVQRNLSRFLFSWNCHCVLMMRLGGAMMTFTAGIILDSLSRARIEQKRIHYLSIAPARGEKYFNTAGTAADRSETDPLLAPTMRKTLGT